MSDINQGSEWRREKNDVIDRLWVIVMLFLVASILGGIGPNIFKPSPDQVADGIILRQGSETPEVKFMATTGGHSMFSRFKKPLAIEVNKTALIEREVAVPKSIEVSALHKEIEAQVALIPSALLALPAAQNQFEINNGQLTKKTQVAKAVPVKVTDIQVRVANMIKAAYIEKGVESRIFVNQ